MTGCDSLPFSPTFTASTAAHPTRVNGASLTVEIRQPAHQANIESVVTQLPKQLPSRLTTLRLSCKASVFEAGPGGCPKESHVGSATVVTPVLPGKLHGTAYFVSYGNAAFPSLDIVLEGDGVTVILVGDTNISKAGVTTSTFSSLPDVPISSFELTLPTGRYSALTSNGSFCGATLSMPTTITGQNNATIKQNTNVSVTGCPIRIVTHRAHRRYVAVTVFIPSAGRTSGAGPGLKSVYHTYSRGEQVKFRIPLPLRARQAAPPRPVEGAVAGGLRSSQWRIQLDRVRDGEVQALSPRFLG